MSDSSPIPFRFSRLQDFPDHSRLWSFVSIKPLSADEQQEIEQTCHQFCNQWKAHEQPLKAGFELIDGKLLLMVADENPVKVSGCATDHLFRLIRSFDQRYQTGFLKRDALLVQTQANTLQIIHKTGLPEAIEKSETPLVGLYKTETTELGALRKSAFTSGIPEELLHAQPAFSGGLL